MKPANAITPDLMWRSRKMKGRSQISLIGSEESNLVADVAVASVPFSFTRVKTFCAARETLTPKLVI